MYGDYVPSNVAAIVVAVIFFILTVLHIWKIITTRHWFAFATVTGGICMYCEQAREIALIIC